MMRMPSTSLIASRTAMRCCWRTISTTRGIAASNVRAVSRIAKRTFATPPTPPANASNDSTNSKIGIGQLPLTSEEVKAEQELLQFLPEFQLASAILHGTRDEFVGLTNSKRAALALPQLERTVEICRSSMGSQSNYVAAALRHLCHTHLLHGNDAAATATMYARGELLHWPSHEHERLLRLLLRTNAPSEALAWCQSDAFTSRIATDARMRLHATLYEQLSAYLRDGSSASNRSTNDLLFTDALDAVQHVEHDDAADVPYLLSQFAALTLVANDILWPQVAPASALTDAQIVAVHQAESLLRQALTFAQNDDASDDASNDADAPLNAPFAVSVFTNIGELLLLRHNPDRAPEQALEYLGKALKLQQQQLSKQDSNALALSRILGQIAVGCHAIGQAVTAEGLLTTAIDAFANERTLEMHDRVAFANVLRANGDLLLNWDKRERGAALKYEAAEKVEHEIQATCQGRGVQKPLHPMFYFPL